MPLKRDVSLKEAIFYGSGTILGAGIYALIGVAAGMTGPSLWMAFVFAGIIAGLTAFSYMKLTAKFPREAAESVYVLKAFGNKRLAFMLGFVSLLTAIFSVAAVSWGFATYFKFFLGVNPLFVAIGAIIVLAFVNFGGIDKSVKVTAVLTSFAALGLILIIVFGLRFVGTTNLLVGFSGEVGFALFPGMFAAAALIFFAFLGFEELANISEEIENPKKNASKAIFLSLLIATVLYVLISIVSVSVIAPAQLVQAVDPNVPLTQGPLALVAETAIAPGAGIWITLFALFATSSTMLALLIVSSRVLYGLSKEKMLPSILSKTHPRTGTPHYAIALATAIAIGFTLIGNLETLGNLTTLGTFLLFFMVNASLVVLTIREKSMKTFSGHTNLKGIPWLAFIGAGFCLAMFLTQYWGPLTVGGEPVLIAGFSLPLIVFGCIVFAVSWPIYSYFNGKNASHFQAPVAVRKFAKK